MLKQKLLILVNYYFIINIFYLFYINFYLYIIINKVTQQDKLIKVSLDASEHDAIKLMLDNDIRHLPVFYEKKDDSGNKTERLHGILYYKDFLKLPESFKSQSESVYLMEQDKDIFVDDYSFSLSSDDADGKIFLFF